MISNGEKLYWKNRDKVISKGECVHEEEKRYMNNTLVPRVWMDRVVGKFKLEISCEICKQVIRQQTYD